MAGCDDHDCGGQPYPLRESGDLAREAFLLDVLLIQVGLEELHGGVQPIANSEI